MAKIKRIPLKIKKFLAAIFLAITVKFKIKEYKPPETKSDQQLEIVCSDDFSTRFEENVELEPLEVSYTRKKQKLELANEIELKNLIKAIKLDSKIGLIMNSEGDRLLRLTKEISGGDSLLQQIIWFMLFIIGVLGFNPIWSPVGNPGALDVPSFRYPSLLPQQPKQLSGNKVSTALTASNRNRNRNKAFRSVFEAEAAKPDLLTAKEAYEIMKESAPESLEIDHERKITGFKAIKKSCAHGSEFGLKGEDYGISKETQYLIKRMGLIVYLQKGNPFPPGLTEYSKDFQQAVKKVALDSKTIPLKSIVDGKKEFTYNNKIPCKVYQNTEMSSGKRNSSMLLTFNINSGDIITVGKRNPNYVTNLIESGNMGQGHGTN